MVFGKILVEKLKARGVKDAELVALHAYQSFQEAAAETLVHPEAEAVERTVCGVAVPVLAGFEPSVKTMIDFNKDGQIG